MSLILLLLLTFGNKQISAFGSYNDVPSVEFERDFKVVQIGNNVTLKCPISVANPRNLQRTWYKGDERIEKYTWERYSLDKKSLQIKGVTYDDTGIFICKGTNGFGSNEVRIDLFVLDKEEYSKWSRDQQGNIPPIFTEETRHLQNSFLQQQGTPLFLPCGALGQPEPDIYWLKNMQKLSRQNLDKNGENLLRIDKLTPEDQGVYTCVARNELAYVAKNFTVKVLDSSNIKEPQKPVLPMMPDYNSIQHLIMPNDPANTTVKEGEVATLQCKAKGRGTWLKKLKSSEFIDESKEAVIRLKSDSFLVLQSSQNKMRVEDLEALDGVHISTLIINKVEQDDAGTYICVVSNTNEGRNTFKYAHLRVISAPPSFDSKEESMLILVGCLGAFVLVLLILIIVCLVKKKNKPQNQALESSPEARERMIEPSTSRYNSPNSMTNTSPTTEYYWSTHHPKIGQPLPPTPVEKNIAHSPLESRHQYRTRGHSRAMI